MVDTRVYDGADRVVQTGPASALSQAYVQALYGTNAAGNLVAYTLENYESSRYNNHYTMALQRAGTYQQASTSGTSSLFTPGTSRSHYDVNGNLTAITDDTKGENNRSFVNDISGKALQVSQSGNIQRQLVLGGEVLARYGVGIDEVNPRDTNGNPNFAPIGTSSGGSVIGAIPGQVRSGADFNFGYQPINGNYPSASAGSYQVATGDTLQSIAQGAYGDSSLWYRIADANGLSGNTDLRVGQTLSIPNRVGTLHNYGANSAVGGAGSTGSFKPYDPSKVQGDSTPNLPGASGGEDDGCGGMGQILVIIVAIVVTVYTAGAASGFVGGFAQTMAAGAGVLGGSAGVGAAIGYGIVGGAVGSIASQAVGIAIGVQEDFSWKGVALAAIGGAVSGGLGASGAFSGLGAAGSVITRAAVGNALTQGIAVVTGLQDKFSWKGVAAAAVGAGVGFGVSEALSAANNGAGAFSSLGEVGGKLARASLTGFAAGLATAAARGGRVSITQVATDAFGQALGESFKDGLVSAGQQEMALRDAHSENQREVNRFASGAQANAAYASSNRFAAIDAMAAGASGYEFTPDMSPESAKALRQTMGLNVNDLNEPVLVAGDEGFDMGRGRNSPMSLRNPDTSTPGGWLGDLAKRIPSTVTHFITEGIPELALTIGEGLSNFNDADRPYRNSNTSPESKLGKFLADDSISSQDKTIRVLDAVLSPLKALNGDTQAAAELLVGWGGIGKVLATPFSRAAAVVEELSVTSNRMAETVIGALGREGSIDMAYSMMRSTRNASVELQVAAEANSLAIARQLKAGGVGGDLLEIQAYRQAVRSGDIVLIEGDRLGMLQNASPGVAGRAGFDLPVLRTIDGRSQLVIGEMKNYAGEASSFTAVTRNFDLNLKRLGDQVDAGSFGLNRSQQQTLLSDIQARNLTVEIYGNRTTTMNNLPQLTNQIRTSTTNGSNINTTFRRVPW